MRLWLRFWWTIIKEYDTEPVQLGVMFLLGGWGLLFNLPGGSFELTPIYGTINQYFTEEVLASFAVVIAIVWFLGLAARIQTVMTWAAFVATVFWAVLATGALLSSPHTWAWLAFTVLALQSSWVFLRRGG